MNDAYLTNLSIILNVKSILEDFNFDKKHKLLLQKSNLDKEGLVVGIYENYPTGSLLMFQKNNIPVTFIDDEDIIECNCKEKGAWSHLGGSLRLIIASNIHLIYNSGKGEEIEIAEFPLLLIYRYITKVAEDNNRMHGYRTAKNAILRLPAFLTDIVKLYNFDFVPQGEEKHYDEFTEAFGAKWGGLSTAFELGLLGEISAYYKFSSKYAQFHLSTTYFNQDENSWVNTRFDNKTAPHRWRGTEEQRKELEKRERLEWEAFDKIRNLKREQDKLDQEQKVEKIKETKGALKKFLSALFS